MNLFFSKLKKFFVDFKNDSRIPERDKKLLLAFLLIAIIINIAVPEISSSAYGIVFTLILIAFIPDYLFNVLDQTLLLSLYPFDMKSFQSLKRFGQFMAMLAPGFITNNIWLYEKDVI